jgi:hypothetical protein
MQRSFLIPRNHPDASPAVRRRRTAGRAAAVGAFALTASMAVSMMAQAASAPTPSASDPARTVPVLTEAQIAAMSPRDQAGRLDPLRAVAAAVGTAGRGPVADVWGNLEIDGGHERVKVYITDVTQAARVTKAALAADPKIDASLISYLPAKATHRDLDAATQRVVGMADADQLPYKVDMVGPASDASGLEVKVDDTAAARTAFTQRSAALSGKDTATELGVPLVFTPGHPLIPKAWTDTKWHDASPFIGGDAITRNGAGHGCTAGLPAVRKSDHHPIMVTAAHCFPVGSKIYTMGGKPGSYGNGLLGNYVGTVTASYPGWDAETVDGADNNADVSDTTTWDRMTSVAYSYKGDYVCHDGQRSFYMGHPTPCGINVTNADMVCGPKLGCPGLGYNVRGVWGEAGGWGAAGGDSGATMFVYKTGGTVEARGILSDGDAADGAPGVFWSEAPDIFNYYGLMLNPRT